MNFDNGAGEAANDTVLQTGNDTGAVQAAPDSGNEAIADDGEEGEGQSTEPEWAEIEIEGKKYRVEAAAKDGYLRQADYTRKTQEVAEQRRAFEADRQNFGQLVQAQNAHFQAAAKLHGIDQQLQQYANVDWQTLYQTNPELYQQHRINFDSMKDKREAAAREFSTAENNRRQASERENANRMTQVQAEVARLIPEWAAGNETDTKLRKFGADLGFSAQELTEYTVRNPKFALVLNRLRLADEAAQKQKTQQTFQQSQQAKPVQRVGGNGGGAARKTTDSSGDALSTEEWAKRERERMAAKIPPRRRG